MREVRRVLDGADFVYYGDTANVPYGSKSTDQIRKLCHQAAQELKKLRVDVLIVACNTASSTALDVFNQELNPVPVLGVVEPGVEATLSALANMREELDESGEPKITAPILILATQATVNSQVYGKKLRLLLEKDRLPGRVPCPIIEQACPLLVPMIEEGLVKHPILDQAVAMYVGGYAMTQEPGVVLLGCTHFPWVSETIKKALPGWKVVDSAKAIAMHLLQSDFLRNYVKPASDRQTAGKMEWVFTDPNAVPDFAKEVMRDSK